MKRKLVIGALLMVLSLSFLNSCSILSSSSNNPHGTYTNYMSDAVFVGELTRTINFKNSNTLVMNVNGEETVYYYHFATEGGISTTLPDATSIHLQDVVTNDIEVYDFKYIKDQDIAVINQVPFYKHQ